MSKAQVMRWTVDEALRFKPVGPVVLREAVSDDANFPGNIVIEEGTAILVHLAEMNLCKKLWSDPKSFCPIRFLERDIITAEPKFFPFGQGPKVWFD